ncbi:MAG: hypothetical protein V4537_04595 [Pseudomonadota bacterium]
MTSTAKTGAAARTKWVRPALSKLHTANADLTTRNSVADGAYSQGS